MRALLLRSTAAFCAACSLLGTAAPALADYDPFRVPKEQLRSEVHVIALMPMFVPSRLPDAEGIRSRLEALLVERLAGPTVRVLPSSEFHAVWLSNAKRLGGIFDPLSGDADQEKYKSCFELTARELARRSGVDTIARSSVLEASVPGDIVYRPFEDGFAMSMGEYVTVGGQPLSTAGTSVLQDVQGLRFGVTLYDASMSELYSLAYPIEWRRVYWRQTHYDREGPPCADPDRNDRAVWRATLPLGFQANVAGNLK